MQKASEINDASSHNDTKVQEAMANDGVAYECEQWKGEEWAVFAQTRCL